MASSYPASLVPEERSQVSEFYTGRSVFVTGATGFLGKVLLEKLLRSCPDIDAIYILVRPKAGFTVKERVEQLLAKKVFGRLREEQPDFGKKVIPIAGDTSKPQLGMSPADQEKLSHVSVVFHSAATIKFDEPLRHSILMNLIGTREVINLCKKLQELTAFVHVSTAYCNSHRGEYLEEKIYQSNIEPQNIMEIYGWMDDKLLDVIGKEMMGTHPNTYTFTKSIAEKLLGKLAEEVPVAIIRPSIVTASWQEPFPGWVDSGSGANGVIAMAGKGMIRNIFADWSCKLDLIPVDINVNSMISAAWYINMQRSTFPFIVHCSSGSLNPLHLPACRDLINLNVLKNPVNKPVLSPHLAETRTRFTKWIYEVFYQYLPAVVFDFFLILTGQEPRVRQAQVKVTQMMKALDYFLTHEWTFESTNILKLNESMCSLDKKTFFVDIRKMSWKEYFHDYQLGIKQYLFKENLDTIPSARAYISRMRFYKQVLSIGFLAFVLRLVIRRWLPARQLLSAALRTAQLVAKSLNVN